MNINELAHERLQLAWSTLTWVVGAWILVVDVPFLERMLIRCSMAIPPHMEALLGVGRWWPLALLGWAALLCHRPWRAWLNILGSLLILAALYAVMCTFHRGIGYIGG